MPSSHGCSSFVHWLSHLAAALDPRSAPRLVHVLLGAVLANGRRTVTSWLRAAGLSLDFRAAYRTVAAAGRQTDRIAARLVCGPLLPVLASWPRLVFALDDTPTQRYGPRVQGAGIHHNPTPGPAGSAFVYGHVWVVLALLAPHPSWGMIALPLLARLYVRAKDLVKLKEETPFRTKLELAVELVRWAAVWLKFLGKPLWLVADGAYAKAVVLGPLQALGVTIVSRLRKDAALHTVPGPRPEGRKGRPRLYGAERIELAKRAGHRRGWQQGTFLLYGRPTSKRYKSFLATWRPAGGVIRVVLVDEPTGWVAFFCTDPLARVDDVLTLVAARFALETAFRDCKEVVGAGQQQVRDVWANVGAFHVCLWTCTLTEAWAWSRPAAELANRAASPWDDPSRRPSHADKRRAWRRELLREEIHTLLRTPHTAKEIHAAAERLLRLAA